MADPEYEELSSKDKDTFTSVCNRLLAETFVLRTLVKPGGETINNPEYSFLSRNFSLVRDYLSLIDWELVRDDFNGFFYVRNAAQANKLVFNKMATGILLALRLLYEENEGRLGLAQDLECSVQEVLEKVVTDYGILGKRPDFRDVGACMRQMDAHNLIARLEGSYEKPTGRFAILPTILAAVPSDRIRAVAEQLRAEENESGGTEAEMEAEEGAGE